MLRTASGAIPTLIMHLSMVAPVPEAHLSFIEVSASSRRWADSSVDLLAEHDDLGVLAAELDHRAHVGVQALHGERDRVHLLHKTRAR
jgi:hypothetical protein